MRTIKDDMESILVARLKTGDYSAFETLYMHYSSYFLYKLEFLTKDDEDAADLLQELFIKVWERREGIDLSRSFSAFLHVVLRNMVIDYFRIKARMRYLKADNAVTTYEEDLANNPEELFFFKEAGQLLKKAVGQLPAQQQVVFQLCKIEGRSYKEVAALMNISPRTVHQHLYQAVRSVKRCLIKTGNLSTVMLLINYVLSMP